MINDETRYLKDRTVAAMVQVHPVTVWRWVRQGKFPKPIKLDTGSTRWRMSDVQEWMDKQEVQA